MNDISSKVMELLNNPSDTKRQIDEFSRSIEGNPKAQVEQLISSGKMSGHSVSDRMIAALENTMDQVGSDYDRKQIEEEIHRIIAGQK